AFGVSALTRQVMLVTLVRSKGGPAGGALNTYVAWLRMPAVSRGAAGIGVVSWTHCVQFDAGATTAPPPALPPTPPPALPPVPALPAPPPTPPPALPPVPAAPPAPVPSPLSSPQAYSAATPTREINP